MSCVAVSDFSLHKDLLGADYTCRLLGCSFRDVDTGGAHASAFAPRPLGDSDMSLKGEKWNWHLKKNRKVEISRAQEV